MPNGQTWRHKRVSKVGQDEISIAPALFLMCKPHPFMKTQGLCSHPLHFGRTIDVAEWCWDIQGHIMKAESAFTRPFYSASLGTQPHTVSSNHMKRPHDSVLENRLRQGDEWRSPMIRWIKKPQRCLQYQALSFWDSWLDPFWFILQNHKRW